MQATRLLGVECTVGRPLAEVTAALGVEFVQACHQVLDAGRKDRAEYLVRSRGCWIEARIHRESEGLTVSVRDVTEQCGEEQKLLADVDPGALRALADEAATAVGVVQLRAQTSDAAVIRERPGLAWTLHDSVTQLLFATVLRARASQLKLKRTGGGADEKEMLEMLADVEDMSAAALVEMRALLVALPPRDAVRSPAPEVSGRAECRD